MGNHIDDLNHPRKRKHVFEFITNDLISNSYNVNVVMVQNKWRSLIRSYNKAKDSRKTTGVGPSRFQFYDLLDEILGDKPTNNCSHSLNSIENIQPTPSLVESVPSSSRIVELADGNRNENQILQKKSKKREASKLFDKEYLEMKKEEYKNRQKRHNERVQLQKEKVALDNRKLELLEKFLLKK